MVEYDPAEYKKLRARRRMAFVVMVCMAIITITLAAASLTMAWALLGMVLSLGFLAARIFRFVKARQAFVPLLERRAETTGVYGFFRSWMDSGAEQPERASFSVHVNHVSDESDTLRVELEMKEMHFITMTFLVDPTFFRTLYGPNLMDIYGPLREAMTMPDAFFAADEQVVSALTAHWNRGIKQARDLQLDSELVKVREMVGDD
ncbi:MAG TPA: hypothetical protein VN081_00215 [Dongiaceae bacterium]|nr:hypothetical protein [Dongiaceae bacterium]